MAINLHDYTRIAKNLRINNTNKKEFLFDFRIEGKRYRKIVVLGDRPEWNKTLYIREAQSLLIDYQRSIEIGTGNLTINQATKLNELWELYYQTLDQNNGWTKTKKSFYERYLQNSLGKKKIGDIQEHQVVAVIRELQSQQLATRTINTTLEILRPLFDFAIKNKVLQDNPTRFIQLKKDNVKKIVTNATETFKCIFEGIINFYKDNPFYCALFLFGFTGRRKSEILKLQWKNIDFENNYYWIEDTKNNEHQKYVLPSFISVQLLKIQDTKIGLVFKSPITGAQLENTDRQMARLKSFLKMPELTLHYMRNVLVSALAEQGTEAITLSGILGHKDATTINKYLSLSYHTSSKKGLETIDKIIDVNIE